MEMALDEPSDDEKPVEINGIDVLISDFDMNHMDDTTVDYVKQAHGEGFVINGPETSC